MKRTLYGLVLATLALLSACAAPTAPPPTPSPTVLAVATTPAPQATDTAIPTAAPATVMPTPTALPAEPSPTATPTLVASLLAAFPDPPQAQGQVLLLFGRVLDRAGQPVPGAAVEIWHTDSQGIYDHPGDRNTARRDRRFQFYGTAIAAADGLYVFRTIEPGYYAPRPKHIHVKVKLEDRTVLTTQFYFPEDRQALGSEGIFGRAGDRGEMLILKPVAGETGGAIRILSNDLVLPLGEGPLTPTPPQAEGPYYPVVDVAAFDNDLTVAP
ncbi:MAG: hypothetical protein RMN24_12435 [Anaerolineae bacterium]|nr:hypothetical protein [Anaerolineae bacterium]